MRAGEQGISAGERPHAERAIARLFEAPGVDMVASYDRETGTYELRSRTGLVRWQRWATPNGELRYVVVAQQGDPPIPSGDGTVLSTMEEEVDAAGGDGRHVPRERNSYPDMLARLTQLWDDPRAPEFVFIPTTGGDANHPGGGSHGIPDIVQSRSPLVIAGPGIARGAVLDGLYRHEDLAPTIAELVGVRPVVGTNASGVRRRQWLRWQDGRSIAGALIDARTGARAHGAAQRALVLTVDGMSQPLLLDELQKGTLPNIARLVQRGTMLRHGSLAEYPTVTWANHNTLMTGASPGHHGLLNNSWWDRERQQRHLITDGGFRNSLRTGRLMRPEVETIYEAVERSIPGARTVAINQPAGRGADVSVLDVEGIPTLLRNIVGIAARLVAGLGVVDRRALSDAEWRSSSLKDGAAIAMAETFWSQADPPRLGVIELTLLDNQGHLAGPRSPQARAAMRQVDRQVGRVLDTLERRGIADSTAVVLTSDHGMAYQSTDRTTLGGWFEALDRAAADGAVTQPSTRFVYVRSMRWSVVGDLPQVGTRGELAIRVGNDDTDASGAQPPVAGATVIVRDAKGREWRATTDGTGVVRLAVEPGAGPLSVTIEHADFSREQGTIAVRAAP